MTLILPQRGRIGQAATASALVSTYRGYIIDEDVAGSGTTQSPVDTAAAIGTAPSAGQKRWILLAGITRESSNTTNGLINGIYVNDNLCTMFTQHIGTGSLAIVRFGIYELNTGTTCKIGLDVNGFIQSDRALAWWTIISDDTADLTSAHDQQGSLAAPLSVNINVPAGGACFAGTAVNNGDAATTTWTGLTERYDLDHSTNDVTSAASDDFASAQSGLTVTSSLTGSSSEVLGAISFGPNGAT